MINENLSEVIKQREKIFEEMLTLCRFDLDQAHFNRYYKNCIVSIADYGFLKYDVPYSFISPQDGGGWDGEYDQYSESIFYNLDTLLQFDLTDNHEQNFYSLCTKLIWMLDVMEHENAHALDKAKFENRPYGNHFLFNANISLGNLNIDLFTGKFPRQKEFLTRYQLFIHDTISTEAFAESRAILKTQYFFKEFRKYVAKKYPIHFTITETKSKLDFLKFKQKKRPIKKPLEQVYNEFAQVLLDGADAKVINQQGWLNYYKEQRKLSSRKMKRMCKKVARDILKKQDNLDEQENFISFMLIDELYDETVVDKFIAYNHERQKHLDYEDGMEQVWKDLKTVHTLKEQDPNFNLTKWCDETLEKRIKDDNQLIIHDNLIEGQNAEEYWKTHDPNNLDELAQITIKEKTQNKNKFEENIEK